MFGWSVLRRPVMRPRSMPMGRLILKFGIICSAARFETPAANGADIEALDAKPDHLFFALFDKDLGDFAGHVSYLRINRDHGSIELGHIALTPAMQRSRAATEAWALIMSWAFYAGYRRFEWKCNAANAASRQAAERLGFQFEGIHRQAMIIKGKNRDTAWYSVFDQE